jgi:hypothetical protein
MKTGLVITLAAAALALGGCNRNAIWADVARFHSNAPLNRGTVFLQPVDPVMASNLEFRTHAESVAVELRRNGFQTVPTEAQAQYLATLDFAQTDGTTITRPGLTPGAAPANPAIATPVGRGPRDARERTTTVGVRLTNQASGAQVWEGRASKTSEAASRESTLTWAVPALSGALFREFPGKPGVTQRIQL